MIVPIATHAHVYQCRETSEQREQFEPPVPEYTQDTRHWERIEDLPYVSQSTPYVGDLCPHEAAWLKGIPGGNYSALWRFTVEPAGRKVAVGEG